MATIFLVLGITINLELATLLSLLLYKVSSYVFIRTRAATYFDLIGIIHNVFRFFQLWEEKTRSRFSLCPYVLCFISCIFIFYLPSYVFMLLHFYIIRLYVFVNQSAIKKLCHDRPLIIMTSSFLVKTQSTWQTDSHPTSYSVS